MNATMKEIKEAGYSRIYKIMERKTKKSSAGVDASVVVKGSSFIESILHLSMMFSAFNVESYSALRYAQSIDRLSDKEAGGLKRMMHDISAWVMFDDKVDSRSKRKFMLSWDAIWEHFAEANGFDENAASLLNSVGIKLPLYLAAVEHDDAVALKIKGNTDHFNGYVEDCHSPEALYNAVESIRNACMFYNMVLNWTASVRNKQDTNDLLWFLLGSDFSDFEEYFKYGDRIWVGQ